MSDKFQDLRWRILEGEQPSVGEMMDIVRHLAEGRQKVVERAQAKGKAKHVDIDALFTGSGGDAE